MIGSRNGFFSFGCCRGTPPGPRSRKARSAAARQMRFAHRNRRGAPRRQTSLREAAASFSTLRVLPCRRDHGRFLEVTETLRCLLDRVVLRHSTQYYPSVPIDACQTFQAVSGRGWCGAFPCARRDSVVGPVAVGSPKGGAGTAGAPERGNSMAHLRCCAGPVRSKARTDGFAPIAPARFDRVWSFQCIPCSGDRGTPPGPRSRKARSAAARQMRFAHRNRRGAPRRQTSLREAAASFSTLRVLPCRRDHGRFLEVTETLRCLLDRVVLRHSTQYYPSVPIDACQTFQAVSGRGWCGAFPCARRDSVVGPVAVGSPKGGAGTAGAPERGNSMAHLRCCAGPVRSKARTDGFAPIAPARFDRVWSFQCIPCSGDRGCPPAQVVRARSKIRKAGIR